MVCPLYPLDQYFQIQPTVDLKYFLKNSRKFQKVKFEFAMLSNYLDSIYIVLVHKLSADNFKYTGGCI